jgi:hypothetical protein
VVEVADCANAADELKATIRAAVAVLALNVLVFFIVFIPPRYVS